jgi:hypothetical protein
MTKPDGGPAFPTLVKEGNGIEWVQPGMSLRDWVAGLALQGIITTYPGPDCELPGAKMAARTAYEYADAMLVQRDKAD